MYECHCKLNDHKNYELTDKKLEQIKCNRQIL
jgi:hypothetical protein